MSASLSPVVATLRDISARHGDKAVHGFDPGIAVTDPSGWIGAGSLTSGDGLTDLLDSAQRRWRAQPHAAAALAWKCYSYWAALPALVGYAGSRRVPLPTMDSVLVRHSQNQPFLRMAMWRPTIAVLATDPLAAEAAHRSDIRVCADDAALRAEMRRALVDEHLEPLMAGIRSRVHLGRRTLWGSLASGVAHGLVRAADSVPGPILPTIHELLTALGADDLVDITTDRATGRIVIARRTCCLAFTLPEPKVCTGCCIR